MAATWQSSGNQVVIINALRLPYLWRPLQALFLASGIFMYLRVNRVAEASHLQSLRAASGNLFWFVMGQFIFSLPVIANLVMWCTDDSRLSYADDALASFAFDALAQGCELVVATSQIVQAARQVWQIRSTQLQRVVECSAAQSSSGSARQRSLKLLAQWPSAISQTAFGRAFTRRTSRRTTWSEDSGAAKWRLGRASRRNPSSQKEERSVAPPPSARRTRGSLTEHSDRILSI